MGNLAEAEKTLQKALVGYRKNFGPDSTNVHMSNTLYNLGDVHLDQGKLVEAKEMMLEAGLENRQRTVGTDHEKTRQTAQKLETALQRLSSRLNFET